MDTLTVLGDGRTRVIGNAEGTPRRSGKCEHCGAPVCESSKDFCQACYDYEVKCDNIGSSRIMLSNVARLVAMVLAFIAGIVLYIDQNLGQ
jgi:hypothetical protein